MTAVKLKAEIWPGGSIEAACEQLMRLSRRLETDVLAEFNGVTLIAQPNGDAKALQANWESVIKTDRPYKVVNSQRAERIPLKEIDGVRFMAGIPDNRGKP